MLGGKSKKIKVSCEAAASVPIGELEDFQGELKSLSRERYETLKNSIVTHGFAAPIFVWRDHNKILDGHQRLRTVKNMMEQEGYECDELPVAWIDAKNERDAKRLVLSFISVFGTVEAQGLYEFATSADLTIDEMQTDFVLPDIDWNAYKMEFHQEFPDIADGKEYDESVENNVAMVECPECGHKFPK